MDMRQFKMFLLVGIVSLFATYANADGVNIAPIITYLLSDTATATPKEIAIDKISAYADDQENPEPTVQDYADADVTGVTIGNIGDVNSNIADKTASEVDTTEEIQAVVDSVLNAVSFENDVMPIFVDADKGDCKSCHSTTTNKRTFKVGDTAYTYDNITSNDLIVPGDPDSSSIFIKGNGGENHKGKDKLSDENSQIVRDWIEQGGEEN